MNDFPIFIPANSNIEREKKNKINNNNNDTECEYYWKNIAKAVSDD